MPHAEIDGDRILVDTIWHEKELIKQVPGSHWVAELKMWEVPLAWGSCIILRGVFGPSLTVGEQLNKWAFGEIANRVGPATALRKMTEPMTDSWLLDGLYPFQRAGVNFLDVAGDALLGDDMGTGKTVQALRALELSDDNLGLPALVICPNSVKATWSREAARWFPEAHVYVLAGSSTVKMKILKEAEHDPLALVVINIEGARGLSRLAPYGSIRLRRCRDCSTQGDAGLKPAQCEVHPKLLNTIPFRTVIVDEAHRIKDPQSKQTRACWAIMHGPTVRRRWALTGTPLANHPGDLWSIMHGVNRQDFPTKSKFTDRYCLMAWNAYGAMDVVGINPEHRDEFFKILDPRFRRMPKSLVLAQLPPKIRSQRLVEMSPKQAAAYKDIEEGFLTRLTDGGLLVAPNNLAAQVRLLQLSSSYCQVEKVDPDDITSWKVTLCEPSPKVDELELIMEELGDEPLVVAAESRQLIYLASARLTKNHVPHGLITGLQNTFERERALEAFQSGRTRVLLFTVKAGGTGLTMTRASTIVFLQRSWSMIDNMQAEDRVHRIGSEHHATINVIDVVTRDTVEDRVQIPRLYEKFERLQEILRDRETLAAAGRDTTTLDAEQDRILAANLGV
jgi:SNF2 family DNA or RNA helicase